MDTEENLFEEFAGVSKEAWLAKAEKDLRGKPLSDLEWQLGEDLSVAPFYHPDDMEHPPTPLWQGRAQNQWELGELIEVNDLPGANSALREGLEGGAEAPLLILHHEPGEEELDELFDGVELSFISTHFTQFYPGKQPGQLLRQFVEWTKKRKRNTGKLAGSIDYDPILDWNAPPFATLVETMNFARKELPQWRVLQINGLRFHAGPENASQELALIIAKGSEYLAQLQERDIEPAQANEQLQFTVALSTSYFVDIAKLRALRLLWNNVLQAYGAPAADICVVAHLARETQGDDPNTNMIKAGTQAMSAVIGGARRLYIRPADFSFNQPSTAFTRRIARNVQHILRMESYLDRVIDPAAGSYYIEKLTEKLAEQAWTQFKHLEAEEAFRSA